ncbi:MAG: nuclear transport factor 2 family protein [Actinomycetota bacterium]|nr:nuclear transport factor 2 family protein [Actinomycetota bacterium]
MDEKPRSKRSRKWAYIALSILVGIAAIFLAGMWFADQGERSVSNTVDSYINVYAGSDSTKDVADLLPLYKDDAVLRDTATDRTHEGISDIEAALDSILATPDFNLTVSQTMVGDDWALVQWTADGTRPDTGRVTQVAGTTLLEVSKGKIARETWYYDPAKAPF